jgi:hypothetical protein
MTGASFGGVPEHQRWNDGLEAQTDVVVLYAFRFMTTTGSYDFYLGSGPSSRGYNYTTNTVTSICGDAYIGWVTPLGLKPLSLPLVAVSLFTSAFTCHE